MQCAASARMIALTAASSFTSSRSSPYHHLSTLVSEELIVQVEQVGFDLGLYGITDTLVGKPPGQSQTDADRRSGQLQL